MKKLSVILLSVLLMACGDKTAENNTATMPATTETVQNQLPVYRVGTVPEYAPYGFRDEKGNISGLDSEVLQAIAKNQGFAIEMVSVPWEVMPNQLQNKEVDILAHGLAIDDFPQDVMTATNSYIQSADCIWAKNANNLVSWRKGTIATPSVADMQEELAEKFDIHHSQLVVDKLEFGSLQSLIHDRADVVLSDCLALDYFGKRDEFKAYRFEKMLVPESDSPENSHLVFMVRKDDTELLNKINQGLANIKQNGELAQIEKKWR